MKKKKWIVVLVIILILVVVSCSKSSKDNTNDSNTEDEQIKNVEQSTSEEVTDIEEESIVEETDLSNLVTVTESECVNGVVAIFDNSNDIDVAIHGNITYYDSNDASIGSDDSYLWDCAKKGKGSLIFDLPNSEYATYKTSYEISDAHKSFDRDNLQADYEINANLTDNGNVVAEFKNINNEPMDEVSLACVYYKDGKVLSYVIETKFKCSENFSVEFSSPLNADFSKMDDKADSYEIFINETVKYE